MKNLTEFGVNRQLNKIKSVREQELLFISRVWNVGRGKHTSIEHFMDYFPRSPKILTGAHFERPYKLFKHFAAQALSNAYTSYSAGIEIRGILEILKRRPQFIFFPYGDYDYFYAADWAHLVGAKIMIWSFFSPQEIKERFGRKEHLQKLDLICCTGQAQYDVYEKLIGRDKVALIPIGVDTDFFRPPDQKSEKFRILQVGVNRRDIKTAIHVCLNLKSKYPDLEIDFVGNLKQHKDYDLLSKYCSQPENQNGFRLHHNIDDAKLLQLYQQATLLLLALEDGGSSNSANEAMACGLPIVATRIENLEDYLSADFAILCERGDVEGMAQACENIYLQPSLRQQMSLKSRSAAEHYRWPRIKQLFYQTLEKHFHVKIENAGNL